MARFSPCDLEIREIGADGRQAVGVIERLREADRFLAVGDPLLESSLVRKNNNLLAAGHHGRKRHEAEAFPAQLSFKQR